jgi:Zn-dependent protease
MDIIQLLFYFLIIIPSSIVHEYAHGFVADKLGDPTARHAGRLTLNPLAHIDLYGTILLPLFLLFVSGGNFMFAYAKPVPYNPFNLSSRRWGPAIVALAGPASNLILAIIFSLLIKILPFTFLPVAFFQLLSIIVFANVLLAIFNLVPIPPLDGSKILFAVLPASTHHFQQQLERSGFIILILFLFFGFQIITPIVYWVYNLLLGL